MFGLRKKSYVVTEATGEDYADVARLHAASFPRGWTTAEITNLTAQLGVTLYVTRTVGRPKDPISGFNMVRQTLDEGEILSIAVDSDARRNGLADQLMRTAIRALQADRVKALLLEVDGTNVPAVHLYQKLGFETVGSRPGYYRSATSDTATERATALVMRLDLG